MSFVTYTYIIIHMRNIYAITPYSNTSHDCCLFAQIRIELMQFATIDSACGCFGPWRSPSGQNGAHPAPYRCLASGMSKSNWLVLVSEQARHCQPDTNRTDQQLFYQKPVAIVSNTCHLLPKVRGERILCTEQICCRRSRMELTDVILLVV